MSNQDSIWPVATEPPVLESSWPPLRQTTLTGVPFALMPRAFASASLSGNSESCSPWVSRVGAWMWFRTPAGLACAISVRIAAFGLPVRAASW